jgi:tetratricopeptide (TPR) repeat protein
MKRYTTAVVLLASVIYFSTTGFQCGSAESTSAKLYMQQKQWDKAEESLLKEVAKNPNNDEAWFLLGQIRLELKKYLPMNEAYTKCLEISNTYKNDIDRNRLAIWAQMYNDGIGFYNKGRDSAINYDRAIERFEIARAILPDSVSVYYVLAVSYYARKDNANTEKALEAALAKKPNYPEASRLLGQLHMMRGDERKAAKDDAGALAAYEKAATAFEAAYKADQKNPENIISLIDAYQRANKSDKAMAITQDAVKSDPNNRVYRYAYGVFLLKQDKFAESIEQLKKVLEISPDANDGTARDATYNLGVAYLNWGVAMKEEADKKAEAAMKGGKPAKDVKEDLSFKEKYKAAVPYLEQSTQSKIDDVMLWQQLAKVYANLNMVDKMKRAFAVADSLMKGN